MAEGCPKGYYLRDGQCKRSITTRPERRGTYGEGFLSEPQQQEYEKINQVEEKEPPQLVVRQTAAMNSWTSSDRKGEVHQHARNDLEYAEKIEHREDPGPDPPGRSQDEAWDQENYDYDTERGDRSGAEWAREREEYDNGDARRKGQMDPRGGDARMVDSCPDGKELVHGYERSDGTEVAAYCRDAHDNDTPEDKRIDSEHGKIAGEDARDWEGRDKRK